MWLKNISLRHTSYRFLPSDRMRLKSNKGWTKNGNNV